MRSRHRDDRRRSGPRCEGDPGTTSVAGPYGGPGSRPPRRRRANRRTGRVNGSSRAVRDRTAARTHVPRETCSNNRTGEWPGYAVVGRLDARPTPDMTRPALAGGPRLGRPGGSVAEARIRPGQDLGEPGHVVGLFDPVGAVDAGAIGRNAERVDRDLQVGVVQEERLPESPWHVPPECFMPSLLEAPPQGVATSGATLGPGHAIGPPRRCIGLPCGALGMRDAAHDPLLAAARRPATQAATAPAARPRKAP